MRTITTKILTLTVLMTFVLLDSVFADPPTPPLGKVWVLNYKMSDEFNAQSPNVEKWKIFDKADSWGRTASFDKRVHEVVKDTDSDNYYLTMNPMWYYEDERFPRGNGLDYYFAGGGMNTQSMQTYGYFEVRIKPSDFPMGSGVFMNSKGTTPGTCNEKYATELDIIENMGYTGPFNEFGNGTFNNYQHVNSHTKPYSDASGNCERLPFESTNSGVKGKPLSEPLGFNTVGMWWKDGYTAQFYNNNEYFGTITPSREFYLPMPVILTMETYGWGSDEHNATNPKPEEWMFEDNFRTKERRAVTYDWVRTWKLIDINTAKFNSSLDNVKGIDSTITAYPGNRLSTTIIYSAKTERKIFATVFNPLGTKLAETTFDVSKGVQSIFHEFLFDADLTIADGYKIIFDIKDGSSVLKSDSSIVNVITKPLEKKLFSDGIPTSLEPGKTSYNIDVKYEADTNCTIVIETRKPDGSWFGGGSSNVDSGTGIATINVTTPSETTVASNYFYKVYMHRQGYDWRDPLNTSITPTIYFNVENPLVPAIKIVTTPTEIKNNATSFDVEFTYETTEDGTLDIKLINSLNQVVAHEHRTERIGSRSLTRSVAINSVLPASSDYKIAIVFSPKDGAFSDLTDTVYSINVNETVVSIANNSKWEKNHLKVYPNPTNNLLNIEMTEKPCKILWVEVFDAKGYIINHFNIKTDGKLPAINVSNYATGVYFVKVITTGKTYTTRFIKR